MIVSRGEGWVNRINKTKNKILISKKAEVLHKLHDDMAKGHVCWSDVYLGKSTKQFFLGPLKKDVHHWCRRYDVCVARKSQQGRSVTPKQPYNIGRLFQRLAINNVGSCWEINRGNKYILLTIDYMYKRYMLRQTIKPPLWLSSSSKAHQKHFGVLLKIHSYLYPKLKVSVIPRVLQDPRC